MTPAQVAELLDEAQTWRIVEPTDRWRLTRLGADLGSMVESALQATGQRAVEHFAHFTDYLPRRWWPDTRKKG